jgi:ankyrin repeat protein
MAAVASSEGVRACPAFNLVDVTRMLDDKCSLEAFQERMLSCAFDPAVDGETVRDAAWRPENRPIRTWLRSLDFSSRVGAIEWEDRLGVFFEACEDGDEEYVSRLVEEHPEWLDKGSEYLSTPILHAVCQGGLMRFVPELIARFGEVDAEDRTGRTPLFCACRGGRLDTFQFLLDRGASVTALTRSNKTMLHAACEGGNAEIVKALLDMGLDVNARDEHGMVPFHKACEFAGLSVVSMLAERGADVNAASADGSFSLERAVARGDLEIVRYLCEHGAVPIERGHRSLMSVALGSGRLDVAEYLLSVGVGLENIRMHPGEVLDQVIARDCVPVMDWLLSRGVVRVSPQLIDLCTRFRRSDPKVLRYLLLQESSAPFLSDVDESRLPPGLLGGHASLSEWRERALGVELRYLMLSWRRGFVAAASHVSA